MSNTLFDWPASDSRFIPFDAAQAADVNAALDTISAGFDVVELKTNAALRLPDGETSTTLPVASTRKGKVVGFNATTGALEAQTTIGDNRGDWATATDYVLRDIVKDGATKDIYQCAISHTSGVLATDVAAGKFVLLVDASTATTAAGTATAQAGIATTKAGEASDSADAAAASALSAANLYDSFDDRYLGAKASDPTVDNDGNALLTGALYFNSTAGQMRAYSGSAWEAAYLPASGYLEASDIGTTVQAYDADTAKLDVVQTFTAQQTFQEVKDTVHTIVDGAAFEIDPANGSIQVVTLGAARTPAATNFEAGQVVLLGIDDGTDYSITWTTVNPTWVKAGGSGAAPTLATSGYTWVLLWKVGSQIYATEVGQP